MPSRIKGLNIAICGAPEAGKTAIQNLLAELVGAVPCDDGRPMRDAAIALLGFSEVQVTTDRGKAGIFTPPHLPAARRALVRDRIGAVVRSLYNLPEGSQRPSHIMVCGVRCDLTDLTGRLMGELDLMLDGYADRLAKGDAPQVRDPLGHIRQIIDRLHGDQAVPTMAIAKARARHGADANLSFGSVRGEQALAYRTSGGLVIEVVRPGKEPRNSFDFYNRAHVTFTVRNDLIVEGWRGPGLPPAAEAHMRRQMIEGFRSAGIELMVTEPADADAEDDVLAP